MHQAVVERQQQRMVRMQLPSVKVSCVLMATLRAASSYHGATPSVCAAPCNKPLSKLTSAYPIAVERGGGESSLIEVVLSARRSCVLRCGSLFERDLLVLTLKEFLKEWPPPGAKPQPLLTNGITIDVAISQDTAASGGGGWFGLSAGPAAAASSSSSRPAPFARGASSGQLIHIKREGLTKPLTGAPLLHETLLAAPSKMLHADGAEYSWFRTARTGGRALVPHAYGPSYMPTADDFGCMLTVVCLPYARKYQQQRQRNPPCRLRSSCQPDGQACSCPDEEDRCGQSSGYGTFRQRW